MAKVALSSALAPYTNGVLELELDVANVRQLFAALGTRFPELQPQVAFLDTGDYHGFAEEGIAVAIDDEIYQDALLQPIPPESEVVLITKIAGG